MKGALGRRAAGIGYGFLGGAAAGLIAGVLASNLWPFTLAGVVVGIVAGLLIAAASRHRRRPEQR